MKYRMKFSFKQNSRAYMEIFLYGKMSEPPLLCSGLGLDSVFSEDPWGYCNESILACSWTQISHNRVSFWAIA